MSQWFLEWVDAPNGPQRYPLSTQLSLGRGAENDLAFAGPEGARVSYHHARVELRGDHVVLIDLNSSNGIFMEEQRITGEVPLQPGHTFRISNRGPTLRVVLDASPLGGRATNTAGNYTVALAEKLKENTLDAEELRLLLGDEKRVERIVGTGTVPVHSAAMLKAASGAVSHSRRRYRPWLIGLGIGVAVLLLMVVGQRIRYLRTLKTQEQFVASISSLQGELSQMKDVGETERSELVRKLRAAERELFESQEQLKSQDRVVTCRTPLACEVQKALADFGKVNYVVPDDFVLRVQKYINGLCARPQRWIMSESIANKAKYGGQIEAELARGNLPKAYLYLAMHESRLNPEAVSVTGARGIWQFVVGTGRDMGLSVPGDWRTQSMEKDERTDPAKSTAAGVRYVKRLLAELGDPPLAMIAYNAGPGAVRSALRQLDDPINNRDFWYVYRMGLLSEEANEYVPKIVATMIIDQNRKRYGFAP